MIKRVFRQMLFTQILSAMAVTLCMLIDSIMIGRFLGVEAMAAYGFANPILLVFTAIGSLFSSGIQVLCAYYMGKGDMESINRCYSTATFFALTISSLAILLITLFSHPLAGLLGAEPGTVVYEKTSDYLIGFVIGSPAIILAQVMIPFLQMSGKRNILAIAVVSMTVGDVLFDFLNVCPLKLLGGDIFGMGLASSISYFIALFIGLSYFIKKDCLYKFSLKSTSFRVIGDLGKKGIPAAVNAISLVFLVFVINRILAASPEGETGVAAYSVIQTISNICYAISSGVGTIALMLSGIMYSEEDRTSVNQVIRLSFFYSIVLDVAVTVIGLIAAPVMVRLFIDDNTTVLLATTGLRFFCLSLIPSSLNTSLKNFYQGTGRVALAMNVSFLQNFLMPAIFAIVLSSLWGTTGTWLSYLFGESFTFISITLYVWRKTHKITVKPENYALMPDDFGAKDEDCLEKVIRTPEDIIAVSKAASDFLSEKGHEKRICNMIALCIEEMANNTYKYGFSGKNTEAIEIRLVDKKDRSSLRIRDNCRSFDPIKYVELHKDEDPFAHIGIRMVTSGVTDAYYVNSLGLNNLTIVMQAGEK